VRKISAFALFVCLCMVFAGCGLFGGNADGDTVYLDKPTDVTFTANTGVKSHTLSWNGVAGAREYEIKWTADGLRPTKTTTATSIIFTDDEISAGDVPFASLQFRVHPVHYTVGKKTYFSNDQNETVINTYVLYYTPLVAPSIISFNRSTGLLGWVGKANATSYKVWYNHTGLSTPQSVETTDTSYNFGNQFDDITPVYFHVQACNPDPAYRDSVVPSVDKTQGIDPPWFASRKQMPTPTLVCTSLGGGFIRFSWSAENATSYYISYTQAGPQGFSGHESTTATFKDFDISNATTFTFSVYANPSNYDYVASEAVSYTYHNK